MNQPLSRIGAMSLAILSGCVAVGREIPGLDCAVRSEIRQKLLFVAVDGVRSDAFEIASTPRIDRLAQHGVLRLDTRTVDVTKSGPGWSTVLTGVWRDLHGVDSNSFSTHELKEHPDLIARLERAHPELTTSFIHSWPPLHRFAASADHRLECSDADRYDECAVENAARQLAETDVDLLFLYLRSIDETGHAFGFHPSVREYVARIAWMDRSIGTLIDRIEHRCSFSQERWLVLAVTDHGGGGVDRRSHGANMPIEREVFSLMSRLDQSARFATFPAPAQTDFLPTALAHFGVTADGIDGRVIVPGERPRAKLGENLIFNAGAELDRGQLDFDVDGVLSGWEENACGAAIAYGGPDAPAAVNAGQPDVGRNLFAGVSEEDCSIRQRIDVSHLDLAGVRYEASALLGGWSDQEDAAQVIIRFTPDRQIRLGPITREARAERTMLRRTAASGAVPIGTKEIDVEVRFTASTGVGDGYADQLSLVLRRVP